MAQQTFSNHAKSDPLYHFALAPLNVALLIYGIVKMVQLHNEFALVRLAMAFSLVLLTLAVRNYGLKNQDRVIRLEENVRLHHLGVDPSNLTFQQLIAIRFAPDAEVPELAQRAAAEKLTPKQIKQAIKQWRADHDRV